MPGRGVELIIKPQISGETLVWLSADASALVLPAAATIEVGPNDLHDVAGERHAAPYARCSRLGDRITGEAEIAARQGHFRLTDNWTRVADDTRRVDRKLEVVTPVAVSHLRQIVADVLLFCLAH